MSTAVTPRDETKNGGAAPQQRGVTDLVESIVDDTRALVAAHVEALRDDMTERLATLGAALSSTLLAFSIIIVTALLLGVALAQTLVALGLPTWAAFWIVTVAAAALGAGLVRRAAHKARTTGEAAARAAERIKYDVTRISDSAAHEPPSQLPAAHELHPIRRQS
jgi:hypothetical protein